MTRSQRPERTQATETGSWEYVDHDYSSFKPDWMESEGPEPITEDDFPDHVTEDHGEPDWVNEEPDEDLDIEDFVDIPDVYGYTTAPPSERDSRQASDN